MEQDTALDPSVTGLNRALAAIRAVTVLDRESVYDILVCLTAKMATSGFTDRDIEPIDHCADWVRED